MNVAESTGMILPAGSPLVQFEVQRLHAGYPAGTIAQLPQVIWVNRNPEKLTSNNYKCPDCTLWFHAPLQGAAPSGERRGICPCMGRFLE